jgi:hypothetical protein
MTCPYGIFGNHNMHSVHVGLDQELVHVPGEFAGPVDHAGPGRDLVIGQGADRFAECLVLLGQGERREIIAHALMVDAGREGGQRWPWTVIR